MTLNESFQSQLEKCMETACEAKSAEEAVKVFQEFRTKLLKELQDERDSLTEEEKALKHEICCLTAKFCKQNGGHSYKKVRDTSNYVESYSNRYSKEYHYHTKTYDVCIICGLRNDSTSKKKKDLESLRKFQEKSKELIKIASEQSEKPGLQKTAKMILEEIEKLEKIRDQLNQNKKSIKEVCETLHNIKI